MAEPIKIGSPRVRDALTLIQIVIAVGVVIGSCSGYFLIQEHVKINSEQITELQQWRYDHEHVTFAKIQLIDSIKERVDACCPLFRGKP